MMMSSGSSANRRINNQLQGSTPPASSSMSTSPSSAAAFYLNNQQTPRNKRSTVVDFEKKLQESDTYLQLVIDQAKVLDTKITQTSDPEVAASLVDIKAKTLTLLDGIKHSIALLQISKVGFYDIHNSLSVVLV
jgi:hypothetical protein